MLKKHKDLTYGFFLYFFLYKRLMEGKKSIEGKVCINESKINIPSSILETTSKFNILVEKFKRLNLIKNKNGLSFEEFNKLIFDNNTVDIFTEILNIFLKKKIDKSLTKSILSIYIFRNFQEREFTENTNLEIKFKGMVVLLVNETNKIMNNYYTYIYKRVHYEKLIERYLLLYLEFMNEKKFNKLNIHIKNFKKYENTFYYIKSKGNYQMNNYLMLYLRKGMEYSMSKSLELFPEFKDYIRDFTVVNKNDFDKELIDKYKKDYYLILKCTFSINNYDKLKNELINIKQRINYYLNTIERMNFINIIKVENTIKELEENNFNNEKMIIWIRKMFDFLKPILKDYNFIYDNENFEESLTDNLSENFIILIKFFHKIFDIISKN